MKLIRWLFSNIILIAFVLALTYAYVYWDNLAGEDTPAGKAIAYLSVEYEEIREFLDSYDLGKGESEPIYEAEPEADEEVAETASVPQAIPPLVQPQSPSRQTPPPQAMLQPPSSQPVRPPAAYEPVQEQPRASQPQPIPGPRASQPEPIPGPRASQPQPIQAPRASVQPQPRLQPARPPFAYNGMRAQPPGRQTARPPAAAMRQPPVAAAEPPVPGADASVQAEAASGAAEPDIRGLWISAREAYHRGDIAQSIANYQQIITSTSDNYDAFGELGNVYLSRGQPREAAGAYYQAAEILVKQGQVARARSLLPVLQRLDRAKAEELNQLIMAPRS